MKNALWWWLNDRFRMFQLPREKILILICFSVIAHVINKWEWLHSREILLTQISLTVSTEPIQHTLLNYTAPEYQVRNFNLSIITQKSATTILQIPVTDTEDPFIVCQIPLSISIWEWDKKIFLICVGCLLTRPIQTTDRSQPYRSTLHHLKANICTVYCIACLWKTRGLQINVPCNLITVLHPAKLLNTLHLMWH